MKASISKEVKKLSLNELIELVDELDEMVETKKTEEKAKAKEDVTKHAERLGFSINELFPQPKPTPTDGKEHKRKSPKPKYRDTQDPSLTWSGRGRAPLWIKEAYEAMKEGDDSQISPYIIKDEAPSEDTADE